MAGDLLGPNFAARLWRILPWAESQMGAEPILQAPTPQTIQPPPHEGKLDANLAHDDTTGVTVSIWTGNPQTDSGRDIKNVLPPIVMSSGTLIAGAVVVIQRIDGYWRVTHAECD